MNEDTFTVNEIRKAVDMMYDKNLQHGWGSEDLIDALQKPAWMPKDGSPYAFSLNGGKSWSYGKASSLYNGGCILRRPITASEIGLEPFYVEYPGSANPFLNGYNDAIEYVNKILFSNIKDY